MFLQLLWSFAMLPTFKGLYKLIPLLLAYAHAHSCKATLVSAVTQIVPLVVVQQNCKNIGQFCDRAVRDKVQPLWSTILLRHSFQPKVDAVLLYVCSNHALLRCIETGSNCQTASKQRQTSWICASACRTCKIPQFAEKCFCFASTFERPDTATNDSYKDSPWKKECEGPKLTSE